MTLSKFEFNLTNQEAENIKNALSGIEYDPSGGDEFIFAIRRAAYEKFPIWILNLLEKQKSSLQPLSHIIINNFVLDDNVTGSPMSNETGVKYKDGCVSENIIAAIGAIVGEPYSIKFEGAELVNNLTPHKEARQDYTGIGYDVELDFHIENAALRFIAEDGYSPMGLILLGVRNDYNCIGPKTFVSDAREALKMLSPEDIRVLYGNNFVIKLPYRWRSEHCVDVTQPCSMLYGTLEFPRVSAVFYPDMVIPLGNKAEVAFKNFYDAIKAVSEGVHITPGKLVYVDNRFTLHSREKFNATFDENGLGYRWVQRVFVAPNLWSFRSFEQHGDRIFAPTY